MVSATSPSSIIPGPLVAQGVAPRFVYFHPDDLTPAWRLGLEKIGQVAIQLILSVGAIVAFYFILPITFSAILLPFASFGVVLAAAFTFASNDVDLQPVAYERAFPPAPLPEPLAVEAPRGIVNGRGNANCWVNSLTQLIRIDRGLSGWIKNTPDCLNGDLNAALYIPREFLFTQAELAANPLEDVPLSSLAPRLPIPPNFAALDPDAQMAHRLNHEDHIMNWIYSIPEINLISHPIETIFSDAAAPETLINAEALLEYPVNDQAKRIRNACNFIRQIRQLANQQQMTVEEKHTLHNEISNYQKALKLLKSMRSQYSQFIDVNELLTGEAVDLVDYIANIPVDQSLAFINEYNTLKGLMLEHPIISVFIEKNRLVADLPDIDRANLLKYTTVLHGLEYLKRDSHLRLLKRYKDFLAAYELAKENGGELVGASSQLLREAFAGISPSISPNIRVQCDPTEALQILESILPSELKYELEVRQVYNANSLPAIQDRPDGIARHREPNQGIITLEVLKNKPYLQDMINRYQDKPAHTDPTEYRQNGVDGVERVYPLSKEQNQYVRAPVSLWPFIKRYARETPSDFFHWLLPSQFPAPPERSVKLSTPIQLDDIIEISTIEEGTVRYKLDAFIVHIGDTPNSGHYISYILEHNEEGEVWYEINDAHVRKISGDELSAAANQAYMPHYSRIVEARPQ